MARVLISMPEEFLTNIDKVAETEQRSRSELIREALRTYINKARVKENVLANKHASILEALLDQAAKLHQQGNNHSFDERLKSIRASSKATPKGITISPKNVMGMTFKQKRTIIKRIKVNNLKGIIGIKDKKTTNRLSFLLIQNTTKRQSFIIILRV